MSTVSPLILLGFSIYYSSLDLEKSLQNNYIIKTFKFLSCHGLIPGIEDADVGVSLGKAQGELGLGSGDVGTSWTR